VTTVRVRIRCLFIVALLLLSTGLSQKRSLAWGSKGHQIIAHIAAERLSSRARKGVADLLGRVPLESVANWADLTRAGRTDHFLPIPLDRNSYDENTDCAGGHCLIKAIELNISILGKYDEPKAKRAEALRYIVHLIGDLHQPLHCADNNDAGGNKVQVYFFGRLTNLHKLWDEDIINHDKTEVAVYAEQLSDNLGGKGQSGDMYTKGTITDWALDSHRLARNAYQMNDDKKLADDYYSNNKPIIDAQLFKAGVRLAKVLNDIFQ
jgi:hypothetical protein